jgi:MFS family permease
MTEAASKARSEAGAPPTGGGRAWWIWALGVTFVVFLFSFQTGYSASNMRVQKDLGLTVSQVGMVAAVYTWVFAVGQFFSGALLDRLGAGRVTPVAISLVTIGILIFANAQSFEMLLLAQFVIACGACCGFVGAGFIGGQWFGLAKYSVMFGLVQVVASTASSFSQNLINMGLNQVHWRTFFNSYAMFGVLLAILGFIFIRNRTPAAGFGKAGFGAFLKEVVSNIISVGKMPHIIVVAIMSATTFATWLSMGIIWARRLLQSVHGFDPGWANFGGSLIFLGMAVGSAFVPALSDRMRQRKPLMIVGAALQLVCLLALFYVPNPSLFFALAACFLFGVGSSGSMLPFSSAADVVKPDQVGTSAAIVNGVSFILAGVMMSKPGVIIDRGLAAGTDVDPLQIAQSAAMPLLICAVIPVVLGFFMKESYPAARSH